MIDKILYRFFGWIDSWFEWVEKEISKTKNKKKKKKLKKVISEEQWIKQMTGKKKNKSDDWSGIV